MHCIQNKNTEHGTRWFSDSFDALIDYFKNNGVAYSFSFPRIITKTPGVPHKREIAPIQDNNVESKLFCKANCNKQFMHLC